MELHRLALRHDERLPKIVNYFPHSASYYSLQFFTRPIDSCIFVMYVIYRFIVCGLSSPLILCHSNILPSLTVSTLQQSSQTSLYLVLLKLQTYVLSLG